MTVRQNEVCFQLWCNPLWLTGLKAPTNWLTCFCQQRVDAVVIADTSLGKGQSTSPPPNPNITISRRSINTGPLHDRDAWLPSIATGETDTLHRRVNNSITKGMVLYRLALDKIQASHRDSNWCKMHEWVSWLWAQSTPKGYIRAENKLQSVS